MQKFTSVLKIITRERYHSSTPPPRTPKYVFRPPNVATSISSGPVLPRLVFNGIIWLTGTSGTLMVITCYPLPQNNGNLPLPFFGGNYPIILLGDIY